MSFSESQILKVACWIKGNSPIPLKKLTPFADDIALLADFTDFQKWISLLKLIVARVRTATLVSISLLSLIDFWKGFRESGLCTTIALPGNDLLQ